MLDQSVLPLTLISLLGLAVGSFLNVVVLRGEREESLGGRSRCMSCGAQLRWYELVPVFSYLLQLGRCRTCKARISPQYPLVELATALTFVAVYLTHGTLQCSSMSSSCFFSLFSFLFSLTAWSLLIAILVYDLRTTLIPDRLSYTFAAIAFVVGTLPTLSSSLSSHSLSSIVSSVSLFPFSFPLFSFYFSLLSPILAGPLLFLPFYLLWKVSGGRWIGLGDGKLALGIGWLLGLQGGGSAIMFAFWIGAAVSLSLMALQRLAGRVCSGSLLSPLSSFLSPLSLHSEIPFGPFLVIGTAIVYFTGFTLGAFVGL